jgi:hypothetical protein
MSKFGHYQEYPERGLTKAKAALLTVWPSLSRYHDDLVLVGGLAVDCLTKAQQGGYPVAVTIDADLGISLGAGGDMYGTISTDLAGLGFDRDTVNTSRYFRAVEGVKIYLDFLTESPDAQTGSQRVDDIIASVVPGINRALDSRRRILISGRDLYGAEQAITVNVAGIGPLVALKANAFGGPTGRRHPKVNGLIVDYANVFQELEKALAIYGAGNGGGELPVKDKSELVEALRIALEQTTEFCRKQNVDLEAIPNSTDKLFIPAVNQLIRTDPVKDEFLGHARDVQRLYKAVMPDPIIPKLAPKAQVVAELAQAVRAQADPVDITKVLGEIERTLDGAIIAEPHVKPGEAATTIDLSQVDLEVLERKFAKSKTKNLEAQRLRALIERKLDNMIRLNASRYDFLDRFQKMIEAYNNGALSIEEFFNGLVGMTRELSEEEQRHLRENVSEEELAVFDILTRPGPDLTPQETEAIKKVCKDLLAKLKTELLVLAWRNKRTSRAAVRVEIEKMLDSGLPEKYTSELFEQKCGVLFQHVLEKYPESGESVYAEVG